MHEVRLRTGHLVTIGAFVLLAVWGLAKWAQRMGVQI